MMKMVLLYLVLKNDIALMLGFNQLWLSEILTLQCFILTYLIMLTYLLCICVLHRCKYSIRDECLLKEYSIGFLPSVESCASNLELNL